MIGKRIAVFGLGRSGLAVAKGALAQGALPTVYDQKSASEVSKQDILAEARELGIPLELGWDGKLPDCDLLVVNPAVDHRHPVLREAVSRGIEVIGEIEFAYRMARAPIIAITGSNGKSSTTVLTYECLRACGESPVLCGNIFGSGYPEAPLTEAALAATADQVLVAEISSFQLEWVRDFRPVCAGITNITEEHLDRYDSFAEYAATKHRIFAAQGPGEYAVVRAMDATVRAPGAAAHAYVPRGERRRAGSSAQATPQVLTFGANGEHAEINPDWLRLLETKVKRAELPLLGVNVQNGAMAALLAYGYLKWRDHADEESNAAEILAQTPLGKIPAQIVEGLRNFRGLAHRMELVGRRNGVVVINNSMCTNPAALIASMDGVLEPTHLLIGGVNKDLSFVPVKNFLTSRRHCAYLFGRDGRSLNEAMGGKWPVFETMAEAFAAAAAAVQSDDILMLAPACASQDQFQDFRQRGDVFRQIAKDWLNS